MTNQAGSSWRQLIQVACHSWPATLAWATSPSVIRLALERHAAVRSELETMQEAARPFSLQQVSVFLAVLIVSLLSPFVVPQGRLCVLLVAVTFNSCYGGLWQGTLAAVLSALVILVSSQAVSHSIQIGPLSG